MISIIIPVFNAVTLLRRTLESVVKQDYDDYEVLLIDDGSTDGSGTLCDSFSAKYPKVKTFHKHNGGQASARNYGLSRATGEYIYFMDDDDELLSNGLSLLYDNMMKSEVDISAASYIIGGKAHCSQEDELTGRVIGNDDAMSMLLSRTIDIYVWTKLYKKSFLIDNSLQFEEGRSEEDILFNLIAFEKAKKIFWQKKPVYIYYEREDSTYRTFSSKKLDKHICDLVHRVNFTERIINKKYPRLKYLATDQALLYYFRAVCLMTNYSFLHDSTNADARSIWKYIKRHRLRLIIKHRQYGTTMIGAIALACLPMKIYLRLKRR